MTKMGLAQKFAARMTTAHFISPVAASPLSTTATATAHRSSAPTAFYTFTRLLSSAMSASRTVATTPLDTLFKQKKALRSKVRKELKSMDPALRSQEDDAIQSIVLNAPWFKSCRSLCAYISCAALREVDTSKILSEILKNTSTDDGSQVRKKVYVPRVEDKNSFMRMLHISKMDDLIANSMDILEPASCDAEGNEREDVMFAGEPVDLFLLPGLAFDKFGRRLGRGGGYYDAFLTKYQELTKARTWKKPLFVALSYSCQILEDGVIPITPNDIPIDALVTSSGVIPISPAADEKCISE
ncbi:5-formyltetrahydrofolate cyclo-ligase, mitochondrial [Andrographis paniculata]|uniref:5-formyltetrahydrofolate cyclo-ligase, mitochondrial n=1 Tax=Andrographis paniculata TaxID=175694 RepID=UPI0021E93A68|nr:5-formyltetrahydrofolate cyclo-ligase, mitochondrial [Andrographis paniculata]